MLNLIATNALSASKLYKRIMRHYCFMQIYEKKKQNISLFRHKQVEDGDLFIDFKLDLYSTRPTNKDHRLFELMYQSRLPEQTGSRADERKGREHETMPYFLTDQYRAILSASQEQAQAAKSLEDAKANQQKKPG